MNSKSSASFMHNMRKTATVILRIKLTPPNLFYKKTLRSVLTKVLILLFTPMIALFSCFANADTLDRSSDDLSALNSEGNESVSTQNFQKINRMLTQINSKPLKESDKVTAITNQSEEDASTQTRKNKSEQADKKMGMGIKRGQSMKKQVSQKMPMQKSKCKGMTCSMGMNMRSMMGMPPALMTTTRENQSTDLPGYAGAPHLYHVGESEFFLDLAEQLNLDQSQGDQLRTIRSQWLMRQNTIISERDSLEQQLWRLTASGTPDYTKIQDTVLAIEALSSKLRLEFIGHVGKAVSVLTAEQVSMLMDNNL